MDSLEKIINNYQTFILDIWGVIHDGNALLPGVKDFLNQLDKSNKDYFFLSNSPRLVSNVHSKLTSLGLEVVPSQIITSGLFFLEALSDPTLLNTQFNLTGNAVVIGIEKNEELLQGSNVNIVSTFEEAHYFIVLAFADTNDEIIYYSSMLKKALAYNLPMVCVNPDKTVFNGSQPRYCQGYFASIYEQMGGKVVYFGKPFADIYKYLFTKFNLAKSDAIMVGDSLNTDIRGANDFGIDSLLVLTGVHKNDAISAELLNLQTNKPTYILQNLMT